MDERSVRARSRSREAGRGWSRERRLVAAALLAPLALLAWTIGLALSGAIAAGAAPSLGLLVGATAISVGLFLLGAGASTRTRAERAARESDSRTARMIDSAMDAVISLDADQRVVVFNRAAEQMFQRRAAEVIGSPVDLLIPERFRAAHRDHIERFGAAAVTSRSMGSLGALRGLRADGEEFPIEASISHVDAGGERIYTAIVRDISDRVRTEEALRDSERLLRLALDATRMGTWALDPRTGARRWSTRSKALFGLPPAAEVDGETIMARVHPADRARLQHVMATVLRPGAIEELDVEFRLAAIDGREERWLHSRGRAFFEDGRPVRVVGTLLDVTPRKRAEEEHQAAERALRESEERFRTMANSMLQLAWIAGPDGSIRWYNERWYEYTGTTPAQMEGSGWRALHDPEVLPVVLARWSQAIAAGERFEMEIPLRGADRRFRTFLTRVQPLVDSDGRVVQWFGTNTDVDALKRAEERVQRLNAELEARVVDRTAQLEAAVAELEESRAELQSLFESLPGLYLVLTTDLVIVAVSDAYLAATLTTREAILGRALFDVFPGDPDAPRGGGAAALRASLERVLRDGRTDTMAIQRYDVRRPDGALEERYWSPINSPMLGAERRIKYIIHRVEDVTDFVRQRGPCPGEGAEPVARLQQMEAEIFRSSQKLQAANLELEAANKELEAFSYSVSHDLRAPLRGVNGYVRIIQEDHGDRLGPEGNRMLDVVAGQAARMGQLIDDLLEFSRLGRTPMRRRRTDMTELARAAFEGLAEAGRGPAPRLVLASLPPALGDPAMLRQVLANLLENAIKFSRDRAEPVIEVGWSPAAPDRAPAEVVYHVKDNGAGFDPRYSDKLFGVFQRLHTDDEFEGTGVGLALVQRIVHRHGGQVWAESHPGEGAAFYFTVPATSEGPG